MSRFLNERWHDLVSYVPGEQPTEDFVKLNTNESPYPPAPGIEALLRDRARPLAEQLRLYPDPTAKQVKKALQEAFPMQGEFFVGNGSDEVLATIFMAYATGQKVYYPAVSYGFYPVYAGVYGSEAVEIPLKNHRIDVEDYQANDGLIILSNPNAPTGYALTLLEIETLLQANPDCPVVIDEAYVDFGAHSSLPLLEKYENLVVVQTFSKSRSLAGLRFGFAASGPEIHADLERLQFARNPYPVDRLTMQVVLESLKDTEYFDRCRQAIMETRAYATGVLREKGFEVCDSLANFLWARPTDRSAEEYFQGLRERKILVRYFPGEGLNDHIRITIGTREQMDLLFAAISAIQRSTHDDH